VLLAVKLDSLLPFILLLGAIVVGVGGCTKAPPVEGITLQGLRANTPVGGLGADNNDTRGFAVASDVIAFQFPQDHGPHPQFRSEWWYLTSVLHSSQGQDYGAQFTLFRQALAPAPTGPSLWQSGQVYLAHLAVSDVAQQRHLHAMRLARGHPHSAGVGVEPHFKAFIEDWSLEQTRQAPWQLQLKGGDLSFGVDLQLTQTKRLIRQGEQGLSRKGPLQASYYYSMPRMRTEGQLQIEGEVIDVAGWTWFDREWSTSVLGDHLQGWDWFALQLDDGRDLMVYRLRREDGRRDSYDHGVIVEGERQTHFGVEDFELTPTRYWQDSNNIAWPTAWRLDLRGQLAQQTLQIEAMFDDQLFDEGLVYWEGIVSVNAAGERVGQGYMELTGYR